LTGGAPHWQVSGPTSPAALGVTPAVTAGRGHCSRTKLYRLKGIAWFPSPLGHGR
ncbi:hypothetical protein GOODEAATRI_020005, partial [Goodea atripinnis]